MSIKTQSLTPGGVMPNRSVKSVFSTAALVGLTATLTVGSANAALVEGATIQFNDNEGGAQFRVLSLYAGNSFAQGYDFAGTTAQTINLGTVSEYHLFTAVSNAVTTLVSSGSRIGMASTSDTAINTSSVFEQIYTTSDPTGGIPDSTTAQINALNSSIGGSIDVTGLASGTVYIMYGSNSADTRLTSLTVDQGASQVVTAESGTGFWDNGDTIYAVTAINFTNNGSENTISYVWDQNGAGKFAGVVLSNVVVPEPSSLALMGLGGLLIARRRRD